MTMQLMEAEYLCEWAPRGTIQLQYGRFEGTPLPGPSTPLWVVMTHWNTAGDLDGDGLLDAAVVLRVRPHGSNDLWYLAAMLNENGRPRNVATVYLGDRVQVRDIVMRNGEIVLDVMTFSADEPLMTLRREKRWIYRLEDRKRLVRLE